MSNSIILLYPCSAKPKAESKKYISVSIQKLPSSPAVSLRLTFETTLQTYPQSFTRRFSQYLHHCPLFLDGCVTLGDYSYYLSSFVCNGRLMRSSLPSKPIVMCELNTTAMFHQTYINDTIEEVKLSAPPKSLSTLQCPLPGLEIVYHTVVTSILYNIMYPSVRLYKGILLSGDHGLGKTSIVVVRSALHP